MTPTHLRRSGACLLAGGLVLGTVYLFFPSHYSSAIRPLAVVVLVGVALMVPGLLAYQRGQSGPEARASTVGWVGAVVTVVGLVLLEVPHCVIGVVDLDRMRDLDAYHASIWGTLEFVGLVGVALGCIVLTVATARAGVYPRLALLALAADLVLTVAGQLVGPIGLLLHQPVANYLLVGVLGIAMIQEAARRDTEHERQPATAAVG